MTKGAMMAMWLWILGSACFVLAFRCVYLYAECQQWQKFYWRECKEFREYIENSHRRWREVRDEGSGDGD